MVTFGSVPRNILWGFLLIRRAHGFKEACNYRKNSNNNTKCMRNLGNCRIFSSVCTGCLSTHLNANNVNVIDFPPKSPDLNMIENIWDELNRCARRTGAIPTTLNELKAKILYKWNNLPQNNVQRHRVAVVNSAGGYTRY